MRQSSPKWGELSPKKGQLSPACAERVIVFLRARHPGKTAEEIALATHGRIPSATAKKWLSRSSSPSFYGCMVLIQTYGPDFLSALFDEQPDWLSQAAKTERLKQLQAEQTRIIRELEQVTR